MAWPTSVLFKGDLFTHNRNNNSDGNDWNSCTLRMDNGTKRMKRDLIRQLIIVVTAISIILVSVYFIVIMAPFQTTTFSGYTAWGSLGIIFGLYLLVTTIYRLLAYPAEDLQR